MALLILPGSRGAAEVFYPKQVRADPSTGFLESYVARNWYRGSGVVARDPRLIYSCGHLFYENGLWATDYIFYRNYSSDYPPVPDSGASPRGFRYFTSYSDNVDEHGGDSPRAFAYDFTVLYGTSSFGPAVGCWADGSLAIRSDRKKRIVGYPATIEYSGDSGYSYQHATDWFTHKGYRIREAYHGFDDVSTGEGNSGGPLFVWDNASDNYLLGGILVSGSQDTAGVCALDGSSNNMASAALGLESITQTFSNAETLLLPDAATRYTSRSTTAAGFSDTVTGLKFSLSMTTPRRGDLNVYLKSPGGRIRWINKASSNTADDLVINRANYTTSFRGYAANGNWQVKMQDNRAKNRATFNKFSVAVSAFAK